MPKNPGTGLIIRPLQGFVDALTQLYDKPPDAIRGIDSSEWGSPLQPIRPIAPDGTEPRGWEWWFGQNQTFTPRPDAEYSAADLKLLSTYPLARICIENVKDQISGAKWEIQLRPDPGETQKKLSARAKGDENLAKLTDFFECPDGEHLWRDWVRELVEDMLVIDAGSILIRKTKSGNLGQLRIIRGESITRLIDGNGWTPQPPDPAYQQNWWGMPLVNLTTDQLVYRPRNIVPRNTVSSQLYGYSPTEQMADEIKVGMKRLEFVLSYYTEGSIPDAIHVVPKGTSADKISEAMTWMNSELAGDLAKRRQWRMIPGFNDPGHPDQIIFPKEKLLADAFDELHIRKICFAYGTSPQRLMRMMGTRNADAQQEAAMEEGIMPWLAWVKSTIDYIIQRKMGLDDYEIMFNMSHEPDPSKQAETLKTLVGAAIMTPNEARDVLGDDSRKEPEADMLGCITGSGFVPIGGSGALTTPAPQPEPSIGGGGPNVSSSSGKPNSSKPNQQSGKPGAGKKPGAGAKPANGNGKGNKKASCSYHEDNDDDCLECSRVEVRRLEKLVPPLASAVSSSSQGQSSSDEQGRIVGFAGHALTVAPPTAPPYSFYKTDDTSEEGEWITINGTHVHLNGEGVIDKGPKEFQGLKPGEISESSKLVSAAARGDLTTEQLNSLSQEQLLSIAEKMGSIQGGVEGYEFSLAGYHDYGQIVSRMSPETAAKLMEGKQIQSNQDDHLLVMAMVAFGPGSVAEEVAAKLPSTWPGGNATDDAAYQKDPELGARAIINGWLLTDGTADAIHIQELARNIGPNAGQNNFVLYHAADKNIAERTDPSPNYTSHVNDIYASTQKYWADQGKADKTIELYRGTETAYATHQPVEPWTTDRHTAMRFNGGGIMVAQVPYKAIFMDYKSQAGRWVPEKDLQGKKEYSVLTGGLSNVKSFTKDEFKSYKRGSGK